MGMSIGRTLLAGLLIFALFLAPLTFSGSVDAAESHTHSSMDVGGNPGHDGHGKVGHGLVHCGSFSCAPTYVGSGATGHVSRALSSSVRAIASDDLLLRSLFLDCDPPVPRGGFSLA